MLKKNVINTNFFKKRKESAPKSEPIAEQEEKKVQQVKPVVEEESIDVKLHIEGMLSELIEETETLLVNHGLKSFAAEIKALQSEVERRLFTVAVVGEFSKGKSSFINNLFGRNILPVSNLPTTAMLTRIRYNAKEAIVVINPKAKGKKTLPLEEKSWDGLVADMNGNDPTGVAFVGLNSKWLQGGLEIIDTPGAGDLEQKRAALIGDALRGSDGAIITVSAEAAMSMSEKLFIEERLISKKTPFMMLIVTKLDLIPKNQRADVIRFIKEKLKTWEMDIPVFVPADIEMNTDEFNDIVGMDKVKATINSWITNPDREKLTKEWIVLKMLSVLTSAHAFLQEQALLMQADDFARAQMVTQKKEMLSKARSEWERLRTKMEERSKECYDLMLSKADEYKQTMTERLEYELSHTANPQRWWKEDYPYRTKVEMTNMATAIENVISRKIAEDARWFNSVLEKTFKTHVLFTPESVANKEVFTEFKVNNNNVKVEDLTKGRVASRIGVAVLSIASYCVCASAGIPPIIGSTGIGTGGSIVSEGIFKKKLEEQKENLRAAIRANVPMIIGNATAYSEGRIKNLYNDIINEAKKQEEKWNSTQDEAIKASTAPKDEAKQQKIEDALEMLAENVDKLNKYIED